MSACTYGILAAVFLETSLVFFAASMWVTIPFVRLPMTAMSAHAGSAVAAMVVGPLYPLAAWNGKVPLLSAFILAVYTGLQIIVFASSAGLAYSSLKTWSTSRLAVFVSTSAYTLLTLAVYMVAIKKWRKSLPNFVARNVVALWFSAFTVTAGKYSSPNMTWAFPFFLAVLIISEYLIRARVSASSGDRRYTFFRRK